MGILVHTGWTNVDLSWNQLWASLPKIFLAILGNLGMPNFKPGGPFLA